MKKRVLTAALFLTLALTVGAIAADKTAAVRTDTVSGATQKTSAPTQTAGDKSAAKTFTAQELAAYDGKNGNKAYIAVRGTVYDVTSLFQNGQHHGAQAGRDLTSAFEGQHSAAKLSGFSVVGVLQGSTAGSGTALTSQEQTRMTELLRQEQALEQKEDALEAGYRSGTVTRQEYLKQKAELDAQELSVEQELDALEEKADPSDDHDDGDDYDDHDDRDDGDDGDDGNEYDGHDDGDEYDGHDD